MTADTSLTDALTHATSTLAFIIEATNEAIAEARASGMYPNDFTFEARTATSSCYEMYISGTKSTGSDYVLTGWKEGPVIKAEMLPEPILGNGGWLVSLEALGFARLTDAYGVISRWKKSGQLKSEIAMSIKKAIETFTDQN